jgi:MoaA/NifB/PqqE/SkfB family radical SAM enzyme
MEILKMYSYINEIKSLQIEISSNCNLKCPGCVRVDKTNLDKIHPAIAKNQFLSLDIIKSIVNSSACDNLDYIDFCGSIDDPLMHPQFLEIVEYITQANKKIIIQTNASLRTPEYFKKLAEVLQQNPRSYIKFSIDGLSDTNHLYRRDSNFNKIIENATAYIAAGGNAQWQYIVFPWNKHQVDNAQQLSKDLGFSSFRYRHDRADIESVLAGKQKSTDWDLIATEQEVNCYAATEQQFFITHEGLVWPCCFLHNAQYQLTDRLKEYQDRFNINYEPNWNNLYYNSFDDIISHKFYNNDLQKSFKSTSHGTGNCDRIIRCTQTCSKKRLNIGNHKVIENETI